MISNSTLNDLQDDELRTVIEQSQGLLKQRDEDRKAKALNDARALLASVGLNGKGKSKTGKAPAYHSGHTYQHPANKTLVWNGKGKKPNWLVTLEAEGKQALELAAVP
jgi:DNA-binding protein H-NS